MSAANKSETKSAAQKTAETALPEPVVTCVSDLFSEIKKAEDAHLDKLRQSFSEVRATLRAELSDEFEARFQRSMELAKEQFNQQVQQTAEEMAEEFKQTRQIKSTVRAELVAKQTELEHVERETAAMLENPEVEISRVIRNNTLVAELRSYIKGLQYQVGTAPEK
jgi:glutaredoxin 2